MNRHLPTLILTFTSSVTFAQAPDAPPQPPSPADKDPIQLSVFEVSSDRDYGYRATNAITATGIGTEIINVPINISVLTRDVILDRGASEMRYVVNMVAGARTDNRNESRVKIRGFNATIQEDGFASGSASNVENAERIEVIKGPSSIFNGAVTPGGMVNIVSARPKWQNEQRVLVEAGAFNRHRYAFGSTGPLGNRRLAYQVYGSYRKEDAFADFTYTRIKLLNGGLTWEPVERLTLNFNYVHVDHEQVDPHVVPFTHPAFLTAVQAGTVAPLTSSRAWLDAQPQFGSREPQSVIVVNDLIFGRRSYNANGPDSVPNRYEKDTLTGEAVYRVSNDLSLRLAATSRDYLTQSQQYDSFRPVAGFNRDLIFRGAFGAGLGEREIKALKSEVNYNFDLAGTSHRVLAGFEFGEEKFRSVGARTPVANFDPRTDAQPRWRQQIVAANPAIFGPMPGFNELTTRAFYAVDQISLFEGKFRLLGGARHMNLESYTAATRRTVEQSKTTPQVGALFRASDSLVMFANYSRSFEAQAIVDILGRVTGPITGRGWEVGLKADRPDNVLSGTLGIYGTERSNIAKRDFPTEAAQGVFPLYVLGGVERAQGIELELTYSPVRNLQLILSADYVPEAKTIRDPQTPNQVGVRIENMPEKTVSLWTKYNFVKGKLRGFFVGGGARVTSAFRIHPSWDVPFEEDGYTKIDVIAGWTGKFGDDINATVSLHGDNVFDEDYFDGMFFYAEPARWWISTRLSF